MSRIRPNQIQPSGTVGQVVTTTAAGVVDWATPAAGGGGGGTAFPGTPVQFVAAVTGNGSVTKPTGLLVNDVALVMTRGGSQGVPAGWTRVAFGAGNGGNLYAYGWKRLDATDILAGSWTGMAESVSLAVYRNVVGNPEFGAAAILTSLSATSYTYPALSLVQAVDKAVRLFGAASNGNSQPLFAAPATQRAVYFSSSLYWGTGIADQAGATTGDVAAAGVSWANAADYVNLSVVLRGGSGIGGDGMDLSGVNDYAFGAVASSLPAGWSWENQGSSSYDEAYGRGVLRIVPAAFTYLRGIYRSLPGTFNTALMRWSGIPGVGNEGPGLCLRESSTGKLLTSTWRASGAINLTALANSTSGVGSDTSTSWAAGPFTDWYMMIRKNSTTSWDFLWGPAPNNLETVFGAINVGTYVGSFTPDQIGLYFLCLGGGIKVASLDYLKFT